MQNFYTLWSIRHKRKLNHTITENRIEILQVKQLSPDVLSVNIQIFETIESIRNALQLIRIFNELVKS